MPADSDKWIRVDIASQRLALFDGEMLVGQWPVSTALNGPGELIDSGCTPRGEHRIRMKIGAACPPGTVFVGRRPTGERYDGELAARFPDRDWILTRILWLRGCDPGINRGGDCDSLRRYIYIHGCPDSEPMGVPQSHGCIRMRNTDIIELFDRVEAGTRVLISDAGQGKDANPV